MLRPEIPDKLFFRIGDVCKIVKVEAFVLRFWETEFPQLKPTKSSTGQRMYRRTEVELAMRIKTLLYDEGFTIAGARKQLSRQRLPKDEREKVLVHVRKELQDILTLLRRKT